MRVGIRRSLRTLALLLALAALALTMAASPALSDEEDRICSDTASVAWQVDHEQVTVAGAEVAVPGCDDGEAVGLRLLTTEGSVPAEDDAPLGSEVEDGLAIFDLRDREIGVEPVIGVRVYLMVDGEPTPIATIVVEQRFFNVAGNEQNGLRVTTELTVALGDTYSVPGPNDGWEHVDCDAVNLQVDEEPATTGIGDFEATTSGLHVACYQQVPGGGGPPGAEDLEAGAGEPEVLGVVLERDEDEAAGSASSERDDTAVLGRILARTGVSTIHLAVFAGLAMLAGFELLRRRRALTTSVDQDHA